VAVGGMEPWTSDQWWWTFTGSWAPGDFAAGWSYTVKVRAVDADGYVDPTPATDAFIYDDEIGDVSFYTSFPARVYSLPEIKGNAHDDCGDVAGVVQQVRLVIMDTDNTLYWNGFFWQPDPVWIKAQGTSSWSISTITDPPLPEWQHDVNYMVWVQSSDNADNRDFDPIDLVGGSGHAFLFRKQLTSAGCYLDMLPTYANTNTVNYWRCMDPALGFTGTAKATAPQNIVSVAVEIKDATDNVFWDETLGDWAGSVAWADCLTDPAPAYDALSGHWDWTVPHSGDIDFVFQQGHTYQVRAEATDDSATPKTYISGTESFIFDDLLPAPSNIDPFDDIVFNTWNSLTGTCEDDAQGKIAAEVVLVNRSSDGLWWNGVSWGSFEWNGVYAAGEWDWIYAAAKTGSFGGNAHVDWQVTGTTAYPLPPLMNGEEYWVTAMSFDVAGNEETTAVKRFDFYMDLHGYSAPTETATAGPTNTSGPTATAAPTNTSTVVPTSIVTATATAAVPTVTKTPSPTMTTVPGFSGSGTIGASGGTVTADDSSGNPRVSASFDAGAFDSDTDVTISGSGNCNAVGAAPSGYSKGTSCFDIEPDGDLDANVEICVYYTAADKSAGGGDPDNLTLAYKDGSTWVILTTTVDEGAGTICAETDYIGTFAVLGKAAAEGGAWEWWYYLLIGLGALLVVAIIVLILIRPKGEGEELAEEGYEEEEEI
jgi:hypothetical protein